MIRPFRGLRYQPGAGPLERLVSPPYDRIQSSELPLLRAASPHGAVHLIRGERGPSDEAWYGEAAERLRAWMAAGILAREPDPVFYVLEQEFSDGSGIHRRRRALIGALDMQERDRVLPHERTHARARADRLQLLRATRVHLGLVLLLRAGGPALDGALTGWEELGRVQGLEGALHRFGRVRDRPQIAAIQQVLREGSYVIADGHHRFATACSYAEEESRARCLPVAVVEVADPGLVVLPTHRLLRGLERQRVTTALGQLPGQHFSAGAAPWERVACEGPGTVGLLGPGGHPSLLWRPAAGVAAGAGALDVSRLQDEVLMPLLQGRDPEDHLSYHRDPAPALAALRAGEAELLALVAPISPSVVVELAIGRQFMPQKSTDFFPKVPTGFVFLPAFEEEG